MSGAGPYAADHKPQTPSEISVAMMSAVARGDVYEPLVALRSAAGSSWRWSRGGCGDSPHVRAMLAIALREWCVRLDSVPFASLSVDLLPAMQPRWYGQSAEFRRLPVGDARLSCAVRWHGARPALLWEFEGDMPSNAVVTCSAIDPEFRSEESSGEVLLNAPSGGAPKEER